MNTVALCSALNCFSRSINDVGNSTMRCAPLNVCIDRPWMIGRQRKLGKPGQFLLPIIRLCAEPVVGQTTPLPYRIVGILKGDRLCRRNVSSAERVVEDCKLMTDDPERPLVSDDMMHREHQHMVLGLDLDQEEPCQRSLLKIEPLIGFLLHQPSRLLSPLFEGQLLEDPLRPNAESERGG